MADPAAALATQLKNIEARSGLPLAALQAMLAGCGLAKVAEQRAWLMQATGLGYGDANLVVMLAKQAAAPAAPSDPLDAIYAGPKAPLRALHDAVVAAVASFGPFEAVAKQKTVSLRRRRQFALLGPATKDLLEIGLNARDLPDHPRLKKLLPGGMCQATLRMAAQDEIDATLIGWLRSAYDAAG